MSLGSVIGRNFFGPLTPVRISPLPLWFFRSEGQGEIFNTAMRGIDKLKANG